MSEAKAETRDYAAEYDNTPFTLEKLLSGYVDVVDGLAVFGLGEDGEHFIIPFEPGSPDRPQGSGDLTDARLSRALADCDWGSGDPEDYDASYWSESWVLISPHATGCRDDLADDEACGCDGSDFQWWAGKATAETPGALRVMEWQA